MRLAVKMEAARKIWLESHMGHVSAAHLLLSPLAGFTSLSCPLPFVVRYLGTSHDSNGAPTNTIYTGIR